MALPTVRTTQQESPHAFMTSPHYPSMDDASLAQQARAEPEAFAELYRRHVASVYRYHMAHTGNAHDAEDLTSQTFMAALEGIRSYRGAAPYIAWLMGIASRLRLRFFTATKPEVPLEAALHIPTPSLPTDKSAFQRLERTQIINALKQLSSDRAEALILCFFSELSFAEAASVMGKSEAAVKMLVSRGLQDLRARSSIALEMDHE
ncbi:MAG TPA: RNA polymerase sigma factor [Anaerolineales bacterium]|nr:RNA polymerase sigma factor [Anaerolineales bacterium]